MAIDIIARGMIESSKSDISQLFDITKGGEIVNNESSYTLNNAVDYPLLGLNLYGKSTQDGVPTPDTPVDIVSVGDGGSVEVQTCGKNLLDVTNCINATNAVSELSNGIISFKKAVIGWSNTYIGKFYYKKGNTITISINGDIKYGRFGLSNSNTYFPTGVNNTLIYTVKGKLTSDIVNYKTLNKTVELDYDGMVYIWFCPDINRENAEEFSVTLQVELGDTATGYEPYKGSTATITSALPLCGIPVDSGGNYTDSNGQQWVCDTLVYNADETGKIVKHTGKIDSYNGETITIPYISTTGSLTTGATIIYQLAEPQEIELTAAEMAALRELQTFEGVSNISNDSGADMDVKVCTNKLLAEYVKPITTGLQAQIDELKAAVLSLGGNV